MHYDIVIAGAGPVGLSLALRLGKAKKKVLVLEKNPTTHEHSRAPAIWPRTQEILAELGVIDTFLKNGMTEDNLRLRDLDNDRVLLHVPLHEVSHLTKYPQLLIVPQSRTEKLLAEAVEAEEAIELEFSSELTEFTQSASGVEISYIQDGEIKNITAEYLIGCDGAHSTVREKLGFHLKGETYDMQAALADIDIDTDSPFPILSTKDVMVIGIKIDTTLWRMILIHTKNEDMTLEERIKRAAEQLFPGQPYKNVWSSEFRLHNRICTGFVQERIALAGDAAHLNSPVGGQGMNAGIQDTTVLGKVLLDALENNDPSRLQTYAAHREAAVRSGVNQFTDRLTDVLLFRKGAFLKLAMRTWNLCLKIPFVRKKFLKKITMLDTKR